MCIWHDLKKYTKKKSEHFAEHLRYTAEPGFILSFQNWADGKRSLPTLMVGLYGNPTGLACEPTRTPIFGTALFSESLVLADRPAVGLMIPSVCLLLPISASILTRIPRETEPTGVLWYV